MRTDNNERTYSAKINLILFGIVSVMYNFAGFYCDQSDLAENAAAQLPVNVVFGAALLAYICVISLLLSNRSTYSKTKKIVIYLAILLAGIVGLFGYLAVSLYVQPHWC